MFTIFLNLPSKLRIKIQYYSLLGPYIIKVAYYERLSTVFSFSFNSAYPLLVFQVCRESRDIALSIYKPLFKSDILRNRILSNRLKTLPLIYINPAHNTIYLSTPYNPNDRKRLVYPEFAQRYPDIVSVQSIAVDLSNSEDISTILTTIIRQSPKSLKEIVLVPIHGTLNRSYSVKELEILFVEPDRDLQYRHIQAEDKVREIRATLCPDICVKVIAIKILQALTYPRRGQVELDDYNSDNSFD